MTAVGSIITITAENYGDLRGEQDVAAQSIPLPEGQYSVEEYNPIEPSAYCYVANYMLADTSTLDDPEVGVYYVDAYDLANFIADEETR